MSTGFEGKVREIVEEVLEVRLAPDAQVVRSAEGGWDSLNHLRIVMAVEEEFGVRFDPDEVVAIESLADLLAMVGKKLAAPDALQAG